MTANGPKPSISIFLLAILGAALGCGSDGEGSTRRDVRLLQSALADTARVDTAAARQSAQFDKCAYVYSTEAQLRECLVMAHGWAPQDAERGIAVYKAKIRRHTDSLNRIADSLDEVARLARAEELARKARADRAAERRRDSIYLATHQERLDGVPTPYAPDALPWVADIRTGAYYRTDCAAAARIPVEARKIYGYESEAWRAGRWPSRQPGCQ